MLVGVCLSKFVRSGFASTRLEIRPWDDQLKDEWLPVSRRGEA